jgi:hypothetical protein
MELINILHAFCTMEYNYKTIQFKVTMEINVSYSKYIYDMKKIKTHPEDSVSIPEWA